MANKVFISDSSTMAEPFAAPSDVNCPTVVPVTSNAIFGAETAFIGLDSEEEGCLIQYRLKYRNADLGTSSKAPRFCLKYTLYQYRGWPRGAMGLSRPGLSGFYKTKSFNFNLK
jgi:hypothetical protein